MNCWEKTILIVLATSLSTKIWNTNNSATQTNRQNTWKKPPPTPFAPPPQYLPAVGVGGADGGAGVEGVVGDVGVVASASPFSNAFLKTKTRQQWEYWTNATAKWKAYHVYWTKSIYHVYWMKSIPYHIYWMKRFSSKSKNKHLSQNTALKTLGSGAEFGSRTHTYLPWLPSLLLFFLRHVKLLYFGYSSHLVNLKCHKMILRSNEIVK